MNAELAARLAELEERVSRLEGARTAPEPAPDQDPETFWALHGLRKRLPKGEGGVLFTGITPLPTGEHYEWQQAARVEELLETDWSEYADSFGALGHPVRLLLLRQVLGGARTVAQLQEHEALGTTGQLYHHLRQLVTAGWLQTTRRGQYAIPGARVVPLLVMLATTNPTE